MLKFSPEAIKLLHLEFEAGKEQKEVEIYINGYFLASVMVADISPEAKEALFLN